MTRFPLPLAVLIAALAAPAAHAADAGNGADSFDAHCAECHSVSAQLRNKKGPSLYGIVGRRAGSVAGFNYSAANKAAGITWTPAVLKAYLAGPQAYLPGTTMKFKGVKDAAEIDDLIAFLEHPE